MSVPTIVRASLGPESTTGSIDPVSLTDISDGLSRTPKQLPSRYLYDPLGLALFDAICELPWYGLMRAERRLLASHAGEIVGHLRDISTIVALGCGNGEKLRSLVESCTSGSRAVTLELIDFSSTALERTARTFSDLDHVSVVRRQATYEAGLEASREDMPRRGRVLVVFLGSNIGNCDPDEAQALLARIRQTLRPRDALLLGADLIKSEAALRLAYDDPLGVTGAFNRNLLVRLNREFGTDFHPGRFEHQMRWNARESRVEMHLAATCREVVRMPAANAQFAFEPRETIWTESSYKYEPSQLVCMLDAAQFDTRAQWIDARDAFALTLGEGRPS